ncbi:MAG: hypothetical protein V1743_07875 [Nanoarchaeota archaeon]
MEQNIFLPLLIIAGSFIVFSCQNIPKDSDLGEQAVSIEAGVPEPEPGQDDFLLILNENPDFQEYKAGYPDFYLLSQEKLTPEAIKNKTDSLRGGPHEAFITTYENLTGTDLYEVHFRDPRTKNELVTIIDLDTKKIEQIYLWVKVDAGAEA